MKQMVVLKDPVMKEEKEIILREKESK
jgi:hypothetical protein